MLIKTECNSVYGTVRVYSDSLEFLYTLDVHRYNGELNLCHNQWLRPIDQYAMDLPLEVLEAVISLMY